MKTITKYAIFLMVIICLLYFRYEGSKVKYAPGKDTKESYGDGTFQLLGNTKSNQTVLSNEEYRCILLDNVQAIKEKNGKLYVIGEYRQCALYLVVKLKDNTMQFCTVPESEKHFYHLDEMLESGDAVFYASFDEFSKKDREVFAKMQ